MQKLIKGTALDLSSEGKGVVKNHGDIVFVDGLFPNEEADIEILYQRAGVYFGKVKKIYKLSKDRIQPPQDVQILHFGWILSLDNLYIFLTLPK